MSGDTGHWNAVFDAAEDAQLGWYESDLSQSLKYVEQAGIGAGDRVFVPGAGTSSLVDALLERGCELVLNDISDGALARLRARVGERGCHYLHHDLGLPLPPLPTVDAWVDRAVLHFLLDEEAIATYFRNLRAALRPGGHVLLAEFAVGGAERCAGLPVRQYALADMQSRLGADFALMAHEHFSFVNPRGDARPYLYGLFRREGGADR